MLHSSVTQKKTEFCLLNAGWIIPEKASIKTLINYNIFTCRERWQPTQQKHKMSKIPTDNLKILYKFQKTTTNMWGLTIINYLVLIKFHSI